MNDRVRLTINFDPNRLRDDLARLTAADWIDHFVTQNYDGDWSVIPLRGPATAEHPVMMIYSDPTCTEFADTPFLAECPYFREVIASFQCDIGAARLMKLTPGSTIKEHTDHDLDFNQGNVRLHIPVTTNPEVQFILNGSRVVMNAGECWYLRLSDPHGVTNDGPTDRVHLVLDTTVNDWLRKRLLDSDPQVVGRAPS